MAVTWREAGAVELEEHCAVWQLWLTRRRWEQCLRTAEADGDAVSRERAVGALQTLPEVTPVQALNANAQAIGILTAQRWIVMKAAREQGISLEQIGRALGVSRQSAWEFMQRKIGEHQQADPDRPAGRPERVRLRPGGEP